MKSNPYKLFKVFIVFVFIFIFILSFSKTYSQEIIVEFDTLNEYNLDAENPDTLIFVVTEMPKFPGVDEALNKYISSNLKYIDNPKLEWFLIFILNKEEMVEKILIRSIVSVDFNNKALEILNEIPKRKFKNKNKPFKVFYMTPYKFVLKK